MAKVVRCVLSGSYRKDREGLLRAYDELVTCGCQVVSPHRLEFNSASELFVRDKAEMGVSEDVLEKHHLLAIAQSDFMWLHAPGGYIGLSAALEIGYATARGVPVFSKNRLNESVLQNFICTAASVYECLIQLNEREGR